jgi:hypothetical protein
MLQFAHMLHPGFFGDLGADGKRYAFTNTTAEAVELWLGEVMSAKVRRVANVRLNPVLGSPFEWLPDQKTLLVKLVPEDHIVIASALQATATAG